MLEEFLANLGIKCSKWWCFLHQTSPLGGHFDVSELFSFFSTHSDEFSSWTNQFFFHQQNKTFPAAALWQTSDMQECFFFVFWWAELLDVLPVWILTYSRMLNRDVGRFLCSSWDLLYLVEVSSFFLWSHIDWMFTSRKGSLRTKLCSFLDSSSNLWTEECLKTFVSISSLL